MERELYKCMLDENRMQRIVMLVTEIALLLMALALVLIVFTSLSDYVSDRVFRTMFSAGGMLQILNTEFAGGKIIVDVKNTGPGALTVRGVEDFQVYVDKKQAAVESVVDSSGREFRGIWSADTAIRIIAGTDESPYEKHIIVLYGPGGTQAIYFYYP